MIQNLIYRFAATSLLLFTFSFNSSAQVDLSQDESEILSLSLEKCIELALTNNELIQSSELGISIAESQNRQAESANYPSLKLSSSLAWLDEDPNYIFPSFDFDMSEINLGILNINIPPITVPQQNIKLMDKLVVESELRLVYPLFTGGKISSILEQTKNNIEVARQDYEAVKSELVYNTSRAYYGLVMLSNLLNTGKSTVIRLEATLSLTETMYKKGSGSVTKLDYLKNKMMVESAKGIVRTIEGKYKSTKESLRFLTGLIDSMDFEPAADSLMQLNTIDNKDELLERVLKSNPRLKKVEHAIAIYSNRISEAQSGLWPNVALFGFYKRKDNEYNYGYVTGDNKNQFGVGIGLEYPLFEGFRTINKIDQSEIEYKKLQKESNLLKNSIIMQVNKVLGELTSAKFRVQSTYEARKLSEENEDLTKRAYQNNMAPIEDYLQSQIMGSIMKVQHNLAMFDLINLQLQLNKLANINMVNQ